MPILGLNLLRDVVHNVVVLLLIQQLIASNLQNQFSSQSCTGPCSITAHWNLQQCYVEGLASTTCQCICHHFGSCAACNLVLQMLQAQLHTQVSTQPFTQSLMQLSYGVCQCVSHLHNNPRLKHHTDSSAAFKSGTVTKQQLNSLRTACQIGRANWPSTTTIC